MYVSRLCEEEMLFKKDNGGVPTARGEGDRRRAESKRQGDAKDVRRNKSRILDIDE